ncbi:MAG: hypothetical protein VZR73_08795 [Acutalibacteraceae bacterium]|nr:hypothetical protein [Clostridia bacterium]MEE3404165.1 hypothetical protein [Acutalibacteraceae bacterium]
MAKTREELHELLVSVLGSRNVYFQPPESIRMQYPAIVYARNNMQNRFADGAVYTQQTAYELTVIDKNPDSILIKKVSLLPFCQFDRHYTADNLNHDVFTIYF